MSPIDYLISNHADLMPIRQSKKCLRKYARVSYANSTVFISIRNVIIETASAKRFSLMKRLKRNMFMNKLSYFIKTFRDHVSARCEKYLDYRKYRRVCRYKHNDIIILPDYGRPERFKRRLASLSPTRNNKLRKQNERGDNKKIIPPAPFIIIRYFRNIEYIRSSVHPRLTNVREHMFGENSGERIRVNLSNREAYRKERNKYGIRMFKKRLI